MKKLLIGGLLGWLLVMSNVFARNWQIDYNWHNSTTSNTNAYWFHFYASTWITLGQITTTNSTTCKQVFLYTGRFWTPIQLWWDYIANWTITTAWTASSILSWVRLAWWQDYMIVIWSWYFSAWTWTLSNCNHHAYNLTTTYWNSQKYSFVGGALVPAWFYSIASFSWSHSALSVWQDIQTLTYNYDVETRPADEYTAQIDWDNFWLIDWEFDILTTWTLLWYTTWTNYIEIACASPINPQSVVIQWLFTLNYTWLSFNIWDTLEPYIQSWTFYVPNPWTFSWTYTYLQPLTTTWTAYTWILFWNFTDTFWKLFFSNLNIIIFLLWWIAIALFLYNLFRFRRK
jgi:hypothetical protein